MIFIFLSAKNYYLKELWAKTLFSRSLNNPGLKPGIIDNEPFTDFSPKIMKNNSLIIWFILLTSLYL
jgi:hypothetical protein